MWSLYEQGNLKADSALTGTFVFDESTADTDAVLLTIEDAREEAIRRQLGREEAAERD
jgi:RIO kinase 1